MLDISPEFLIYLAAMAGVTYLVRMIPLVFVRRRITSRFIRSFLYYAPYAVLSAMTFPAIIYATSHPISAIIGTLVALLLAFYRRSLIVVAASSALAVLITEILLKYVFFMI